MRGKAFLGIGLLVLTLLVSWGSYRGFVRGGNDFSVFYEAWRLVFAGRGSEIYRVSPDRFLYSPGFAWIFAPLALLPWRVLLGLTCIGKLLVLVQSAKRFGKKSFPQQPVFGFALMVWGVVFISRPILIDLEYGQVNLFLLGASLLALLGHLDSKDSGWDFFRWSVLGLLAVSKLFPMPLLLVPWLVTHGISDRKLKFERWGVIAGVAVTLLIPCLAGIEAAKLSYLEWYQALLSRGLPLESHNQSFTAFLNHYLSGQATNVMSEGVRPIEFGAGWLSGSQIALLSIAWTQFGLGIILGWLLIGNSRLSLKWAAVMTALVIVPSHLIWKPYFVFSLPLVFWLLLPAVEPGRWKLRVSLFLIFLGINFTGFDFVGHQIGAHFEAASVLLAMHLFLLFLVFQEPVPPAFAKSRLGVFLKSIHS